jgi:hypothetical protein
MISASSAFTFESVWTVEVPDTYRARNMLRNKRQITDSTFRDLGRQDSWAGQLERRDIMITTVMEMTTGQWEIDRAVSDVRSTPVDRAALAHPYDAPPPSLAGLGEQAAMRPRRAGMPIHVATQDLEVFLAAMADSPQ